MFYYAELDSIIMHCIQLDEAPLSLCRSTDKCAPESVMYLIRHTRVYKNRNWLLTHHQEEKRISACNSSFLNLMIMKQNNPHSFMFTDLILVKTSSLSTDEFELSLGNQMHMLQIGVIKQEQVSVDCFVSCALPSSVCKDNIFGRPNQNSHLMVHPLYLHVRHDGFITHDLSGFSGS